MMSEHHAQTKLNAYKLFYFDRIVSENQYGKKSEGSYLSSVYGTVNSILVIRLCFRTFQYAFTGKQQTG